MADVANKYPENITGKYYTGDAGELALQGVPADLQWHILRQISLRDGADHMRDLDRRVHKIGDECV